ncbi:MAG: alpha amylase N-terminal ig-like domain-containing protein [Lachnospiraceae bacterium]|nr:alpha amylase N-terminal ig-like domain-containing protein [Lachnospiraceae bacterium]
MEKAAILHYMDGNYCFMNAKGEYVFRIRTKADDAVRVVLHGRDKYVHMLKSSDKKQVEMSKVATDGIADYYETAMSLDMICFRYFF